MTRLTGLFGLRTGLGHARLNLRDELRLGAVAGEVGEGGTAVSGQGCGETGELFLEVSHVAGWIGERRRSELTEQEGTVGRL